MMNDLVLKAIVAAQNGIARLRDEEEAQTLTEYALIIAVIAIGVLVALYFLRDQIKNLFSKAGSLGHGLAPQAATGTHRRDEGPGRPCHPLGNGRPEPLQGLLRIDEIAGKTPGRGLAAVQNAYYTDSTLSSRGERVRRKQVRTERWPDSRRVRPCAADFPAHRDRCLRVRARDHVLARPQQHGPGRGSLRGREPLSRLPGEL